MQRTWKKIIAVLMALTFMALTCSVAAMAKGSAVKNGSYKVTVNFWQADKNKASMCNPALSHTAKLRVNNGKMTMTIYTHPMTYGKQSAALIKMKVYNGSGWSQANVLSQDKKGNPSSLSFPVYKKATYIPIKVSPSVKEFNGQYLDARLKISWDTLKKA